MNISDALDAADALPCICNDFGEASPKRERFLTLRLTEHTCCAEASKLADASLTLRGNPCAARPKRLKRLKRLENN